VFGVSQGIETAHATNVTNAGRIKGQVDGLFEGGSGNYKISNSATGVIEGGDRGIFITSFGTHTISNAGLIRGVNDFGIQASFGVEKVINFGEILGDVSLGGGDDVFTNFKKFGTVIKNGTINNTIDLGDGNDRFFGSAHREEVSDNDGSDHVKLGGGADFYIANGATGSDGTDVIDAGRGSDSYDASTATSDVLINLGTVDQILIAAYTAQGDDISGGLVQKDTITGFEEAVGGAGNDHIYGSKAANTLLGLDGIDTLVGLGGNDSLSGGDGADLLLGGGGKDTLRGGDVTGADGDLDLFTFSALSDSTVAKAGRDLISDFEDGVDKINLIPIDAVSGPGNDAFSFIGTNVAFTGNAGDLRVMQNASGAVIQGDVNGDGKADFAIDVADPNHLIAWSGADFHL
jgi:Ca2+-binding RTX toxin-like protein